MSKLSQYEINRLMGTAEGNGFMHVRQTPLERVLLGRPTDVVFTLSFAQPGHFALIEANRLQPSHLGRFVNYHHFIPEAQPRNRSLSASGAMTPELIAQNLRPDEILFGSTAYVGPPVVNVRGEVIQGNGRAYALKTYYNELTGDPKGYKQAIIDYAQSFGFKDIVQAMRGFNMPVLVRMVDVSDKEAIRLGQFTQADTEAVTLAGTKSKAKARLLTKPVLRKITNELLRVDDGDKTLTELIRDSRVLTTLIREGILSTGDLELYTKNDTINEAGVTFISDLLLNALFAGANINVVEVFSQSPQAVQNIVKKSTLYLLRLPAAKGLGREVGNAIVAYRDFLSTGIGTFPNWLNQYDLQGNTPRAQYSDVELKMAALFAKNTTQKEVISKFRQYAELVTDQPANMFANASPGKLKSVAVKIAFDARYRPDEAHKKQIRNASSGIKQKRLAFKKGAILHQKNAKLASDLRAKAKAKAKLNLLLLDF